MSRVKPKPDKKAALKRERLKSQIMQFCGGGIIYAEPIIISQFRWSNYTPDQVRAALRALVASGKLVKSDIIGKGAYQDARFYSG